MSYGLIHYNQPDLATLDDFLEFASKAGFRSVEIMPEDVWPEGENDPESRAEALRKQVDAAGLRVCALGAGNDFVLLDEHEIEAQVRRMKRICGLAKILGAPVV